jgi:hypothetical protein
MKDKITNYQLSLFAYTVLFYANSKLCLLCLLFKKTLLYIFIK